MRYAEYREAVRSELLKSGEGLTWPEIKERRQLPQARSCPEWTKWLEADIGLARVKRPGRGNTLVWTLLA